MNVTAWREDGRLTWRGGRNLPPHVVAIGLTKLPTAKLPRDARTDEQIIAFLREGYSQRALVNATIGKTCIVKARISALERSLISTAAHSREAKLAAG